MSEERKTPKKQMQGRSETAVGRALRWLGSNTGGFESPPSKLDGKSFRKVIGPNIGIDEGRRWRPQSLGKAQVARSLEWK